MTCKFHSRSSKLAPIESQCMILYQQSVVTFAVSHTVLEKFDVEQSNDLEISPMSSTVVSRESCHVAVYVICSEDSERKKRKSPFSTTTLSFDAHPANLRQCINLIAYCQKLRSLGYATFLSLTVYGYLCEFSNSFVRKPDQTPAHQLPSPKQSLTQNGHSRSFDVIYFGITEEPLRGYVQHNIINVALDMNWFGRYSERKERKSPFSTTPLSFDPPSPANPREYPHKAYLARNWYPRPPGYNFAAHSMGLSSFKFQWLAREKNVCNATESTIAVQGHFGVNQGL